MQIPILNHPPKQTIQSETPLITLLPDPVDHALLVLVAMLDPGGKAQELADFLV